MRIYNSLTKQKQPFKPLMPNTVTMYVCGMTVYDYCHLGHARLLVCFDLIARYLRYRGFDVTYIRNITDIDDKIIRKAQEQGCSIDEVTDYFIDAMHADERALNILPPTKEPRATQFIPEIISMVQQLLDKGYAYLGDNGDVYYDVSRFPAYGQLSRKDVIGQQSGARVEIAGEKRNPLDFVLWKHAKPGEPEWDSPWGKGRPGWHIECSAMSTECLGNTFDIHGGGFDLQFPHHENEIAQAQGATGGDFAKLWMHVGFLQIHMEKMSKSLGNFFTVRDILHEHPAEVVRFFLLSSHYRSQLNYTPDNLAASHSALTRLYQAIRDLPQAQPMPDSAYEQRFIETMDDDFNSPEAIAVFFELAHEINRLKSHNLEQAARLAATLVNLAGVFGVLQCDPQSFLCGNLAQEEIRSIEAMLEQRRQARQAKDWAKADAIRDALQAKGIEIEDSAHGTHWRRKRD